MSETTCCPDCGAELPTGATGGLCPRCLLGAGISSDSPFELPADSPFAATTPQAGGFVPPTPASLAAYFPDLEVLEIIGQGGMGAVYKARQTKLDRVVALKIIRPESADDPAFAERFTREAKTLARLNHSNIVSIHDFGEFELPAPSDPDAQSVRVTRTLFFFVMEFVDGANLRQLMESGRLQAAQSLAIVPQICDALQYAHDEGVIHRDIKPENILIDRRGRVKIADFGLAKLAGQTPENFTLTGTHQVMGTPRYMAPEQMSGSRLVDHRADIYSLGVVLYEMLTGELPMGRFEPPSHNSAVDARLDDIVHRALESNPDRRYQRAGEIRTDMEAIALDAYSQGELESLDGSVPSGFPGPSTIMERQVAGVVNWFRGGRARDAAPPSRVPAADRAAIRRQVRGPAIALMLTGAGVLSLSLFPLALATDIKSDLIRESPLAAAGLYFAFAVLVFLAALIIRGGWHLLALDRYRPAVLGALLGQPVGIWALIQLSRDAVRSAFSTDHSDSRSLVETIFLNTTLWGVLIAAGGIAVTFLPWAEVYNDIVSDPGIWVPAAGFGWPHGMIAASALIVAVLFLLATAAMRPVPVWRPLTIVVLSGVVLSCSGSFMTALKDQSLAVQPLLNAAEWGMSIDDRTPLTIDEANVATQALYGPYLLMGMAVGLLLTAAFDFRAALQPASSLRRRRAADSTLPQFSRKAIVGAFWAPLFVLAVAAMTIVSDVTLQRGSDAPQAGPNMLLVIPATIVGILGVLAPFATTILGMLAISDIRHAPARIRGLGLAYFDAVFFPLLVMDAVLLFGVGVLVSVLFQSGISSMFAMMLGGPICLVLDAVIAVWGWKYVSRSIPGASPHAAVPGNGVSNVTDTPSRLGHHSAAPHITRTPVVAADSTTALELRRIEMRLKAPAAGLVVVAFLHLLFWGAMGSVTLYEAWGMNRGRFSGSLMEVLGAGGCAIAVLLAVGTIIQGARHLRRLTGVGWCYAAAILCIIPWSMASVVAMFVGIWVLNVLGRESVKEAFVQRSLELDQAV